MSSSYFRKSITDRYELDRNYLMSYFVPDNSSSNVANAILHSSLLSLSTGGSSVASASALQLTSSGPGEIVSNSNELKRSKPKRPLSAYNLFFQHERQKLLQQMPERPEGKPRHSHGKIGFASLARKVAHNWKNIDPSVREHFDTIAAEEKERWKREMKLWKRKNDDSHKKTIGKKMPNVIAKNDQLSLLMGLSVNNELSRSVAHIPASKLSVQVRNMEPSLDKPNLSSIESTRLVRMSDISELAAKLDEECMDLLSLLL